VLLGERFLMFDVSKDLVPSSSGSSSPRRPSKMKAYQSFEVSETTHPTTQHHIPEDLVPQQHHCVNLVCSTSNHVRFEKWETSDLQQHPKCFFLTEVLWCLQLAWAVMPLQTCQQTVTITQILAYVHIEVDMLHD
jgi:hypothetical protein